MKIILNVQKNMQWQTTPAGGSIIHRFLIWEYVAKEILKKPILGHGIGTSRFYWPKYYPKCTKTLN